MCFWQITEVMVMKKIIAGIFIGFGFIYGMNYLYDVWCDGLNETWRLMRE